MSPFSNVFEKPVVNKNQWLTVIFGFIVFLIGIRLYFNPESLPGDLGDSRFNQYILEHGFYWITGKTSSFWNAPFFYPAQNVIAYSDNHLGTLLVYSIPRMLGLDRESAFQAWFLINNVLNFAAAFWVMSRLKIHPAGIIAGAYVFTFGLPVIAQAGHLQLLPRPMVPLGFYFLLYFFEKHENKYLIGLFVSVLIQIYISIYTGYFMILSLVATGIIWNYLIKETPSKSTLAIIVKEKWLGIIVITLLFIVFILPLAIPYYEVSKTVGTRDWSEINTMLPRFWSYFFAPSSTLWRNWLSDSHGLPMAHEHQLFIGVMPWLACVYLIIKSYRSKDNQEYFIALLMILSVLLVILITFSVHKYSLYVIFAQIPGPNSIRAVTRIILVLLFPLSLVLGTAISSIISHSENKWFSAILGVLFVGLTIVDQLADESSYNKKDAIARINLIKQKTVQHPNQVLWLESDGSGNPFYISQLSAMLAAQEMNIPTINGYSGNLPPGYSSDLVTLNNSSSQGLSEWISSNALALNIADISAIAIGKSPAARIVPVSIVVPVLQQGFSGWEDAIGKRTFTKGKHSMFLIPIRSNFKGTGILKMNFESLVKRDVEILYADIKIIRFTLSPGDSRPVEIRFPLDRGNQKVYISTNISDGLGITNVSIQSGQIPKSHKRSIKSHSVIPHRASFE